MPPPFLLPAAAAAAAAYLNARLHLSYDARLLSSVVPAVLDLAWAAHRDRLNYFYRLESAATSRAADRPFVLFEDRSHTYAQTYDRVLRYGNWLKTRMGVEKGQIVALDFQNSDHFLFLFLALWSIGAKPAFLNYNLTGAPLVHCIRKATTSLVLFDPAVADSVSDDVRRELEGVRFVAFDGGVEAEATGTEPVRFPDELRAGDTPQDMAILIYTSGTTGLPKAAIVSWAKLTVAGGFSSRFTGTKTSDVYYVAMPLYHSTATLMGFALTLSAGATIALGRKFSTSRFWAEVRRHDATMIQYVGETCRYLLAAPADVDPSTGESLDKRHRVRMAFGNGLRPDVWDRFRDRFGIDTVLEFYGATEGSLATYNLSRNAFSAGAVGMGGWLYGLALGRGLALVEVDHETDEPRRDSSTGFCRRVPPGEPGELLMRLPAADVRQRFQGYYGDGEATEKKVMRDVFARGDAWFRSGDVMRWDSDGRFYFSDRIGDTFRWKSENVSTAEVAHVLGLHPAVAEANVYGVELPHHDGRAGCAAVVLNDVSSSTFESLARHVAAGLPRYALPLFLRVVGADAMTTTGTNKQQKHGLREQGVAPERTGGDDVYWLQGETYVRFGRGEWEELSAGRTRL